MISPIRTQHSYESARLSLRPIRKSDSGLIGYDDLITVVTRLKKRPNVKIEFEYELWDEKGDLLTEAETTLAFIDMKTNRPIRCPEYLLEQLEG